ncbi:MAG: hypothetical protein IPI67_13875 [Myxococcales bacterium]|nr:hypothetical protein [Myxococcales bacterium]
MSPEEELDDDVLFEPDGHLSDVALTALADGENELLPERAKLHAESCDVCTERLGAQALLSVSVSEALLAAPVVVRAAEPFPVWAVLCGLALATTGVAPMLAEVPAWLVGLPRALLASTPIALRVLSSLFRAASLGGPALWVVWFTATLLLGGLGFWVARHAPRPLSSKGVDR